MKKKARSSDRAKCNEAKGAAVRAGDVCVIGPHFTRKGIVVVSSVALLVFLLAWPRFSVMPVGAQTPVIHSSSSPVSVGSNTDIVNADLVFDNKIETFFEQLQSGSTMVAFDHLVLNSPLGAVTAASQIGDMRARLEESMDSLCGAILGWERHSSKRVGLDIAVTRYILKCENYPMIWTFTFYRKPGAASPTATNSNPWTLIEMRFDSNLDSLTP